MIHFNITSKQERNGLDQLTLIAKLILTVGVKTGETGISLSLCVYIIDHPGDDYLFLFPQTPLMGAVFDDLLQT